jgi:hypothetical protein
MAGQMKLVLVNDTRTEVVTPDLIEAEQLKTVESLSESIEKYQGRIAAGEN